MAITIHEVLTDSWASNASDVGSIDFTLSSTPSDGDLLLLVAMSGSTPPRDVDVPAGWTELQDVDWTPSSDRSLQILYRFADSDGTSHSFDLFDQYTAVVAALFHVSGVADPIDSVASSLYTTTDDEDVTCPSVDLTAESLLLRVSLDWRSGATATGPPAGFSRVNVNSGDSIAGSMFVDYDADAPSGATGSETYDFGPDWHNAFAAYTIGFASDSGGSTYTLEADSGSFALAGQATGLAADRTIAAAVGTVTETGIAAGLIVDRTIGASASTFTLTGIDAGLAAAREMAAAVGPFALTGIDAALTYDSGSDYTLTCEVGAFTETGVDASLQAARALSAAAGALMLSGVDVGLAYGYTMTADLVAFALTGNAAAFGETKQIVPVAGSFALTGNAATLTYSNAELPTLDGVRVKTVPRPITVKPIARRITVYTVPSEQ